VQGLNYPGKKFYNTNRNKIDTVADVIITKEEADLSKDKLVSKSGNNSTSATTTGHRSSFKGEY
jgi:hypothetical protein